MEVRFRGVNTDSGLTSKVVVLVALTLKLNKYLSNGNAKGIKVNNIYVSV